MKKHIQRKTPCEGLRGASLEDDQKQPQQISKEEYNTAVKETEAQKRTVGCIALGRRGDTPSTGMITCPLLRVVVVGMPVHLANSSGRGWSHTSWLFAIPLQKATSTLCRWWWWMHPLRSPHHSGWSPTSC